MHSIYEIKLIDLLPPNLKENPDILAAAKAIDGDFLALVNEVGKCIILPNINNIMDHNLLDYLAWDVHVDYYDSSLSIHQKQNLIKNSFKWHMQKGTPSAVKGLVDAILGEGDVLEWFDYGGEPYMFQIQTSNSAATNEKAEELIAAIDSVKNKRSHLEKVVITKTEDMPLYFSGIVYIGDHLTIRQVI